MSRMRPYTIHILGIRAVSADVFDLPPEQNAVIVCTDVRNHYIDEILDPGLVLRTVFRDTEDPSFPEAMTPAHARSIIRFAEGLPETVTDLYVCCAKGSSRSPAVAAALLRASGRSDMDVWKNPYYVPNRLVYQVLCRELGLEADEETILRRVRINEEAFIEAQKSGGSAGCERWQILE